MCVFYSVKYDVMFLKEFLSKLYINYIVIYEIECICY